VTIEIAVELRVTKCDRFYRWNFARRTYDANNGVTYVRHCATNDGRNLRGSARSLPARRAEPIDPATFPSGGELTSPPSASSSMCPHHLIHLVEPPPDWIPPNIHGSHLTNSVYCLWDSQTTREVDLRINDWCVNLLFFIIYRLKISGERYVWRTIRKKEKTLDNLRSRMM